MARLNYCEPVYTLAPWLASKYNEVQCRVTRLSRPMVWDGTEQHQWQCTDYGLGSRVKQRARTKNSRSGSPSPQKAPVEFSCRHSHEEDVVVRVVKSLVKEIVTNELLALLWETLSYILSMSFHNAQNIIRSAVYNVFEKVMLYLLHKSVTKKL